MIWFETHANSIDNEAGIASGHADPALSALGERQALELGARYPHVGTVWCSDLQRSYRTAEIAFTGRSGVTIRCDSRLREVDFGAMTRTPMKQIEGSRAQYLGTPYPEGESYCGVCRRVQSFLVELRGAHLIIGHRAVWYALEHLLAGRDLVEVVTESWRWQPGWVYTPGVRR